MSDLKLFQIKSNQVTELLGASAVIEKSLQTLMEQHLESFLSVRFLATEYFTGKTHGGRIDTLGIDENNSPVIIEYKRSLNENVINQGLFYLDWLMDHKAEFELLVLNTFGRDVSNNIDWSPRLLCIAGDFSKYDVHAVQQISRNIELLRYKRYGSELFMLELVKANTTQVIKSSPLNTTSTITDNSESSSFSLTKRIEVTAIDQLEKADTALRDRYKALEAFLMALGDDVQYNPRQHYIAFRRLKNFVCLYIYPNPGTIKCSVRLNPDNISLNEDFMRNVRGIGHWGTGDVEITLRSVEDFESAKPFFLMAYEQS